MVKADILIIGGGLTGLTLQYLLRNEKQKVVVLEARERLGGRIHTKKTPSGATIEMGATWLGPKHTRLNTLLTELDLDIFPQVLGRRAIYEWISTSPHQLVELPGNEEPSYRIRGGSSALIRKLGEFCNPERLFTGQVVETIRQSEDGIQITTDRETFTAERVVSTLPPYLLKTRIAITPELPSKLQEVMEHTHTWMGSSIKVGLAYGQAFWREPNSSGTVFSNVGPVSELYDHSDFGNSHFALKGFFNPSYFSLQREERLDMILKQLRKYYGNAVDSYTWYDEAVWADEPHTFVPYQTHLLPHQNNGHLLYQKPYLDGKFFVAGSETANDYPGYMEGAVRSAEAVFQKIMNNVSNGSL
mgnify:CR=1 FL=1